MRRRRSKRRSAANQTSHTGGLLLFSVSRARGIEGHLAHQAIAVALMRTCTLRLGSTDAFRPRAPTRSAAPSAGAARRGRRRRTATTRVAATAGRIATTTAATSVAEARRALQSGSTAPVVARCRSRRRARSIPTLLNSHRFFLFPSLFVFFFLLFQILFLYLNLNDLNLSHLPTFICFPPFQLPTIATYCSKENRRNASTQKQNTHPITENEEKKQHDVQ